MARPKTKQSITRSFSLDKEVVELLDKYSNKTFIPKTKVVEEAIKMYIKSKK